MTNHNLLIKAAELLEKTAEHIETAEAAAYQVIRQHQEQSATKIATNLSAMAGTHVNPATVSKMVGLGPDVVDVLHKLAGNDAVDSLGGPDTEKVANYSEDPDARLLAWLRSS